MSDPNLPVRRALDAIKAVFSDTSVGPEETEARLRELADEIDVMIDSLGDR